MTIAPRHPLVRLAAVLAECAGGAPRRQARHGCFRCRAREVSPPGGANTLAAVVRATQAFQVRVVVIGENWGIYVSAE